MLDKLNMNERIFIGGGALLLVASFLPWHSVDTPFGDFTASGWESPSTPWSILAVIVGVAAAVVMVLDKLSEVSIPDKIGNLGLAQWYAIDGGVVALLIVIKLLDESSFLGFGFYLAIIAAAAMAYAGLANIGKVPSIGGGSAGGPGGPGGPGGGGTPPPPPSSPPPAPPSA